MSLSQRATRLRQRVASVHDERVTGAIRYSIDMEAPGMLHARMVRSPYPHATVDAIDLSALPDGVVALTGADIADLEPGFGPLLEDQPVVARDRVRHIGDIVAAVAAASDREAAAAAEAVLVDYTPLPGVFDPRAASRPGGPLVHETFAISDNEANIVGLRPLADTNVCHRFQLLAGRGEAGFDEAEVVVEETYRVAATAHASMEPHAALAWWDEDGRLVVISGNQAPFVNRQALGKLFRLPEDRVRMVVAPMGGSFGAKIFMRLEPIVAALARKAGRPVRAVLTREEEFLTLNRHPAEIVIRLGARRDGTLVAKEVRSWWDTGAYADAGPSVAQKGAVSAIGPYRIPHVAVESLCVYTNRPPNGALRGYGATQGVWASERCMDTLAEALGMDPLELRLMNLLREGDRFATGETMHDLQLEACLRRAAEAVEWGAGRRGKGLSVLMKMMQTPSRTSAALEVDARGHFVLRSATTEMGQRSTITQRRLAAEALGAPLEMVEVGRNDTDVVPFDTRTTSSRSTHMMSFAIASAAERLKERMAEVIGAPGQPLRFGKGRVWTEAAPERSTPLTVLAGLRGDGEYRSQGGIDPDTGQGIASSEWHQGAAAAEVAVDAETGLCTITRLHAAVYAGRVVDRAGAELQNEGSMVMGVGSALFEQLVYDDGQLTTTNMSDFNVPSFLDVPRLTHDLLEVPGTPPHGLGETAVPPVPPAIGNALATLGYDLRDLPMTPETILAGERSA